MQSIGVITHSASGKDIRRVVARGSTTTNQEKINAVIRMVMAIDSIGAPHVAIMPDPSGIGKRVINEVASQINTTVVDLLEMPSVLGTESDTTLAVEEMQRNGFACVVVFGGDGTCRAAAKGSAGIPIIAISTGTNNVFPERTESTLAGMAAAYIATRRINVTECCIRKPMLQLLRDDIVEDIALVDLVTIDASNNAAQAVWEAEVMREMYLADASPSNVGLSSVGGWLDPIGPKDREALYVDVGASHADMAALREVLAPIVPGLVAKIPIRNYRRFSAGEEMTVNTTPCVACLDGERQMRLGENNRWSVRYVPEAIAVVDVSAALDTARDTIMGDETY